MSFIIPIVYWLLNQNKKQVVLFLQNSQNKLNQFINNNGNQLIEFCDNLLSSDSANENTNLDIIIKKDLGDIIKQAEKAEKKSVNLSKFAKDILMAYEIFHEIAIYRNLGKC